MQPMPGTVYAGDVLTVRVEAGIPVIVVARAAGALDLYPGEPGVICAGESADRLT